MVQQSQCLPLQEVSLPAEAVTLDRHHHQSGPSLVEPVEHHQLQQVVEPLLRLPFLQG